MPARQYQISKSIREMCVFSRQNMASDPPLSHIDLVSCRNVLIYMDAALQRRVLPVLHYAIQPEYAAPIQLERQLCNLAKVWREAWDNLAQARAGRDAELREEMRVADVLCEVSPFHFKGIFRNLLENALSVTPGPVRLVIRCMPAEVRIAIEDNGPGFGPEGRRKAFDPFFTTKLRGTGLGLPICRRLVEAHGGRIELGEKESTGAVILITVPRRKP